MTARGVRAHIRSNVIGYVAVFIALSGSAYAIDGPLPGQDQVGSADIIDQEVKQQDLGSNSVASGKILDGQVQGSDLATNAITDDTFNPALGSSKIGDGAVRSGELGGNSVNSAHVFPNSLTGEDIATNALGAADLGPGSVGTSEIANGAVQPADLAPEAQGPLGFEFADDDTGIICNNGCTEGTLSLPPGFYAVFGKIQAAQDGDEEPLLAVQCELSSGGVAFDQAYATTEPTDDFAPLTGAALSMQGLRLLSERAGVSINCEDFDIGDASGFDLKITAIKLGSFGP